LRQYTVSITLPFSTVLLNLSAESDDFDPFLEEQEKVIKTNEAKHKDILVKDILVFF
jgi:hypothetical protein